VIYFAGHGIEFNGRNFLVPVDASVKSDRDIEEVLISLDRLSHAVSSGKKVGLIILDACRDNPFVETMRRTSATRSLSSRGLARVEPENATLIAYAARGGETALDGDGGNSPYVKSILKHLDQPGIEIGKFFRLVRDDVLQQTAHPLLRHEMKF
jgi:uncharacterized caspase-like protein